MAVKSLKEFQFPGSADSYTFDASLFDGKTADLFALLGGNNEFTGKNVFSGDTSVGTPDGSLTFGMRSLLVSDPDGESYGTSWLPISVNGGDFYLAYSENEGENDLSLYAKSSDLSSYVTNTSLANTLKSYVTSSSLSTTLGSYVTKTSLTTTLGDYVTKTSLSTTLGGYAKLSSNNAFTGTNSFSNAISVDTINSKSTGNSIARMYYDTDKAYKVLLGSVARQITLLGNSDRPYYAKDGEAFNAHSLALSEDLNGYAKLSSENTFATNNNFNGTTWVKYLSFNGGILNGDSTLGVVCDTSRFDFRTQSGESIIYMWGSNVLGRLCLKNMQSDKNDTGLVFYTNKDPSNFDDYAQFLYNPGSNALLGTKSFNTWGTYKINGESMCNYRKLSASAKLDAGAQGSASVTAYGLYVNNVLVKIIGYYTAAVALDTGATGITFNIGWDRQQSSDFQSLGLSYLSSKESLRRVTTDTWHCEVWIDGANYGGTNIRFMLV